MDNYNLDFYVAFKEMLENKAWIKGSDFGNSIYLKLDDQGQIVMVDVSNTFDSIIPYPFVGGLPKQKFRIITVATVKELSY